MLKKYRSMSQMTKILIWLIIGIVFGLIAPAAAAYIKPVGTLFMNLLVMVAIPLVFFNLLSGIASLPDPKAFGRIGGKIIAYYLLTTAVAVVFGLLAVDIIKPGIGVALSTEVTEIAEVPKVSTVLLGLVPKNLFAALNNGDVAQVVVFAAFMGVVTLLLPPKSKEALSYAYDLIAELLRKMIGAVMIVAPYGIFALAADMTATFGATVIGSMAKFILTVFAAQFVMIILYAVLLTVLGKMSFIYFLKTAMPMFITALATNSSIASLSSSLEVADKKFHLPKSVYSFCLPLGSQLNKDGTAIFLAAILMFSAQAAGIDFAVTTRVSIVLVGLLLSMGSSGIPGGGLVIASLFISAFGLPTDVATMVSGVYLIVSEGSVVCNMGSDLIGTCIVARSEGWDYKEAVKE